MLDLPILTKKGSQNGSVKFDDSVLETKASSSVLHEVVVAFQANQRKGSHSTKGRAEVSGGGVKPWRQKGTGRARSGSTRSPLWRKGGIIFGPKPRSYRQHLPKQKLKIAFRMALQHLLKNKLIQVVEPIEISEPKTKHVASVFLKWQAPNPSYFVTDKLDPMFSRAARNIPNIILTNAQSLNTYDCLRARRLFITKEGLEQLSKRLSEGAA